MRVGPGNAPSVVRRASMTLMGAALLVLAVGGVARGQPAPASPGQAPPAASDGSRERAVATVLAADPRFAALPDYETLRRRSQAEFVPYILYSSYYRVLPGVATDLALFGSTPRTPSSWLVTVMLVTDCSEPSPGGDPPAADPCAWRHAWTFRVLPDGGLSLLFDEGDPDISVPVASGDPGPLVGTEWTVVSIGTSRVGERAPRIRFGADGTLSGSTGCNDVAGSYSVDGSTISMAPIVVSDRICDALLTEIEAVFLEMLRVSPEWWVSGDLLKVGSQDALSPLANRILTFQPVVTDG